METPLPPETPESLPPAAPPPPAAPAPSVGTGGPLSPEEQTARTWHMWCHLSALAGFLIPFANLIGPLIIWQTKKNEIPSLDAHGKEAMNFQISVTIYWVITLVIDVVIFVFGAVLAGLMATFCCCPAGVLIWVLAIPLPLALIIGSLVFEIMAGVKANNGILFRYPVTIRFLK
jgi:uncharacterized protein